MRPNLRPARRRVRRSAARRRRPDVANLTARNGRLSAHITRLEQRLSENLGQAAWEASGISAPADIDTLTHRATELEQQVLDLHAELVERGEDLAAARAANRELTAQRAADRAIASRPGACCDVWSAAPSAL
ncbi:hypothetical protein [Actinacidiphila yeochonensis]|uniref:hypothetical protein n=1 Tax=Actinacidiphila yeochonensis TaxID=89050 RepID=UPI000B0EE2C2|nr:hypothetical protein [Actinacidiphila yeochonensis]